MKNIKLTVGKFDPIRAYDWRSTVDVHHDGKLVAWLSREVAEKTGTTGNIEGYAVDCYTVEFADDDDGAEDLIFEVNSNRFLSVQMGYKDGRAARKAALDAIRAHIATQAAS